MYVFPGHVFFRVAVGIVIVIIIGAGAASAVAKVAAGGAAARRNPAPGVRVFRAALAVSVARTATRLHGTAGALGAIVAGGAATATTFVVVIVVVAAPAEAPTMPA